MTTETVATPETASVPPVESTSVPPPSGAKPETAAADTSAPGQSEAVNPDESEAPKKPKVPFSERISQIHAAKKQAEAEAAMARQEAQRLRDELDKLRSQPRDQMPFEDQDALRVREAVKLERLEEKQAEAQFREQLAVQARSATFQAKVEAAAERMPDLVEKFSRVPLSEQAADLIAESDRAAEIAYYLGNNPQEAHEIYRLPAHLQGARIARIEARLSAAPSVRKVSQAPSPPPALSGASSPGVKDPGTMSMEEYAKWRKASG